MDPFSLLVGAGSLIEMSIQVGKYLKHVYEAVASFEEEIGTLFHEIQDLDTVIKAIEHLLSTETTGQQELSRHVQEIWQNTAKILQDCSETVQKLQKVLETITGKSGARVTGLRDGIKKQLRKQAKDGELNQIRHKLSVHQESLKLSLTLLNLWVLLKNAASKQNERACMHSVNPLQALKEPTRTSKPEHSVLAFGSSISIFLLLRIPTETS